MKPVLYNATLPELEQLMHEWNQPTYRARQLYRHMYINHICNADAMTDLPQNLRHHLATNAHISTLNLRHTQTADNGQTRKALFALHDDAMIETVLIAYEDRTTVCVSTQVGCGMGCIFCATGRMGLHRNLSSGEIVEQVIWAAREMRTMLSEDQQQNSHSSLNVVFMGMGEPLANYQNWWAAVTRLHDPKGFHLGARKMTVSTVGIVPGIQQLAREPLPINLAISLHAPNDDLRSQIVPINRSYPIADILAATRDYIAQTHRRVSFEYVLMQHTNDEPHHAQTLAHIIRKARIAKETLLYHVNLIPWNSVPGIPMHPSQRKRVLDFQHILQQNHIACTVRVERGTGIAAACGQLAGTSHSTKHNFSGGRS